MWEKEKLLITNNFALSHSVFYSSEELSAIFIKFKIVIWKLFKFGRVYHLSFGSELRPFERNVFYCFEELSAICIEFKIVVCKLFKFGRI